MKNASLLSVVFSLLLSVNGYADSLFITQAPAETGPEPTVLFESSWNHAVGSSVAAVGDDGTWSLVDGNGVVLDVVATPNPGGGNNSLRITQRGDFAGGSTGYVEERFIVPIGQDFYFRYYMRTDDTSAAQDHIISGHFLWGAGITYLGKIGGPSTWRYSIGPNIDTAPQLYPWDGYWLTTPLNNGEWYRIEFKIEWHENNTEARYYPRVYNAAGVLIGDADDFYATGNDGNPAYTLQAIYDGTAHPSWTGNQSFTFENPDYIRGLNMGNNGQAGADDTGLFWYYSAVKIQTGDWVGPL